MIIFVQVETLYSNEARRTRVHIISILKYIRIYSYIMKHIIDLQLAKKAIYHSFMFNVLSLLLIVSLIISIQYMHEVIKVTVFIIIGNMLIFYVVYTYISVMTPFIMLLDIALFNV